MAEQIYISFDNGMSFETLIVTQLENDIYRLEETPLLSETELSFGDVIRLERDHLDRLIFRETISKSNFQVYSYLIAEHLRDASKFKDFCDQVMQLGGMWEFALGGVLIVHIPKDIDFDVASEINRLI